MKRNKDRYRKQRRERKQGKDFVRPMYLIYPETKLLPYRPVKINAEKLAEGLRDGSVEKLRVPGDGAEIKTISGYVGKGMAVVEGWHA